MSSDLRYDGAALLREAQKFMQSNADQQFILPLEVYHNRKTHKDEYHIHGMSTQPIALSSWSKMTGAKRCHLYCEPLINQLAWAKYINKNLRLLPRNLQSMKSNIKRKAFHAYYGTRDRLIATNDPNIEETYEHLSQISSSKGKAGIENIIASLRCLNVSPTSEEKLPNAKCHLSSSKKVNFFTFLYFPTGEGSSSIIRMSVEM